MPAESKECRRCHETKGKADFYHSKMTADGLQSYCKVGTRHLTSLPSTSILSTSFLRGLRVAAFCAAPHQLVCNTSICCV